MGITPNMVTLVGFMLSIITAAVIAGGSIMLGGALVVFAGIFDMFDGAMARARNESTTFGAFLDSTLDRYSESIILGGLLFYALARPDLHNTTYGWPLAAEQQWMIALIFVAAVGSLLVSYAKARAEGLGLECKTGLLARPERVVILAIGLLTGTTLWALLLLASLSHFTAIERIVHVWRATLKAGGHNVVTSPSVEDTGNGLGRHTASNTDDITSINTVPTSLPPLSGSVHQD